MLADHVSSTTPTGRSDSDILAGVQAALQDAGSLRSVNYANIEAEAHAGTVVLEGHVGSVMQKQEAERRAAGVRGVTAVHNHLVADSDLAIAVAQALAANAPTRAYILHVGVSAGWVQLGSQVPDAQVRAEAESVAAGVPRVRGVVSLPHLPGEPSLGRRRALQPRAGTVVYAADGEIGRVAGVVVDPHNRLVSHIIVNARLDLGRREVRGQLVIPAEAIRMTTVGGTTLTDTKLAVSAQPQFRPADYPRPPADWQLPFPYQPGEVYWPAQADPARPMTGSEHGRDGIPSGRPLSVPAN